MLSGKGIIIALVVAALMLAVIVYKVVQCQEVNHAEKADEVTEGL